MKVRLSDSVYYALSLKKGDTLKFNGGVNGDKFWGVILKRVTSTEKR